jgi:hypothetical protein
MTHGVVQPRYWIWAGLTFVIGLITMVVRSQTTKLTHSEGAVHLKNVIVSNSLNRD